MHGGYPCMWQTFERIGNYPQLMEIIFFNAESVDPVQQPRVLPESAFAALLLKLHEIFMSWTFVGVFTFGRNPLPLHRVKPGRT